MVYFGHGFFGMTDGGDEVGGTCGIVPDEEEVGVGEVLLPVGFGGLSGCEQDCIGWELKGFVGAGALEAHTGEGAVGFKVCKGGGTAFERNGFVIQLFQFVGYNADIVTGSAIGDQEFPVV